MGERAGVVDAAKHLERLANSAVDDRDVLDVRADPAIDSIQASERQVARIVEESVHIKSPASTCHGEAVRSGHVAAERRGKVRNRLGEREGVRAGEHQGVRVGHGRTGRKATHPQCGGSAAAGSVAERDGAVAERVLPAGAPGVATVQVASGGHGARPDRDAAGEGVVAVES